MDKELWVLVGTFIGGFITFLVTAFQSWQEKGRLKIQLTHDEKSQETERNFKLVTTIYFEALGALNESLEFLVNIPHVDIQKNPAKDPINQTLLQRVNLVGSKEILEKFNECGIKIADAFIDVMPDKLNLSGLETDKNFHDKIQESLSKRQSRITSLMEELNKDNNHESSLWRVFDTELPELNEQREQAASEIRRLIPEIAKFKFKIQKDSQPKIVEISKCITELLILIRKELKIKNDAETLEYMRAHSLAMSKKYNRKMKIFFNDMETRIEIDD